MLGVDAGLDERADLAVDAWSPRLGGRYALSPDLRLGLTRGLGEQGHGVASDWGFFPILALDWRITDRLKLYTGRGSGAFRGPGLTLNWAANDRWSVSLGARYEKDRFRLEDRGVAAVGIGEATSTPIYLAVSRKLGRIGTLRAVAGVELNGSLRLEDAGGGLLGRGDFDDAPFAGATFDLRF